MKQFLLAGLGNPEPRYLNTRHNAGFMLADFLAADADLNFSDQKKIQGVLAKNDDLLLLKPSTYMNLSGQSVRACLDYFQIDPSQLVVAFDDLDLELGSVKLQFARGPKTHRGLYSIYQHLKTEQFWHLRLGVDSRAGDRTIPPDQYVLKQLLGEETAALNLSFIEARRALQSEGLLNLSAR